MVIKRSKILFLFLFVSISVFAQYTETINSNRPGFSQGAFSVGKDVLQFETGFGLGKEEHSILIKKQMLLSLIIILGMEFGKKS